MHTPKFQTVTFDWMIPVAHRERIETELRALGYRVDGGGTDLSNRTASIHLRPAPRVRKKRSAEVPA